MIVDLAAATGLISSAPMPGYGKRFEDVTAADVAEWRRIFGEDFVQLQLSQQGSAPAAGAGGGGRRDAAAEARAARRVGRREPVAALGALR